MLSFSHMDNQLSETPNIKNRSDVATLLASIGEPGKKRKEKLAAIKALGKQNTQKHGLEMTLESYKEY